MSFKYLQGWWFKQVLEKAVPVLNSPLSKDIFPTVQFIPPMSYSRPFVESGEVSAEPPFCQAKELQFPQPFLIRLFTSFVAHPDHFWLCLSAVPTDFPWAASWHSWTTAGLGHWSLPKCDVVGTTIVSVATPTQAEVLSWCHKVFWHLSLFIGEALLGQKFGVEGLFICMKDDGETCSLTGRPFYLSTDIRLQGSPFISAAQPVNGHCRSWNPSCLASLISAQLLGTCVGKAESVLPHVKTFPLRQTFDIAWMYKQLHVFYVFSVQLKDQLVLCLFLLLKSLSQMCGNTQVPHLVPRYD